MTEVAGPNCIDIIAPFRDEMDRHGMPEIQIMGGIGSAALVHPGTEINLEEQSVVTSADFLGDKTVQGLLAPIRPEDGTRRDLDMLVLSSYDSDVELVESMAELTVDGTLDNSVFGLHKAAELKEQIANPFGWRAFKTFLSDRYEWSDGRMKKSLFPFAVPVDREVFDTWRLEVGDQAFPITNPATMVLNYLTRSISGLRPKDADKVDRMARHVFGKEPELAEWTVDGPGQSHMELAGILQTLRRSNSFPRSKRELNVGGLWVKAGSVRELIEDEAFMIPDASPIVQELALLWAVTKARGLGIGESQDWAVKLYRKYFESMFDGITKNGAKLGS